MPFIAELKIPEIPPELKDVREKVLAEARRGVSEAAILVRATLVEASPVGGTGLLRNSWTITGPAVEGDEVEARVSSTEDSAIIVEEGARPHFPPWRSPGLQQWVRRKLGIETDRIVRHTAFKIALAISERGLPATRVFGKAIDKAQGAIDAILERAQTRIGKLLGGG